MARHIGMEGHVYPEVARRAGMETRSPDTGDREFIDTKIFRELVHARFLSDTRAGFRDVIRRLRARGCDAVVLGCTEIPLLVAPEDSPLPVLDSTRILARAALRKAMIGESA